MRYMLITPDGVEFTEWDHAGHLRNIAKEGDFLYTAGKLAKGFKSRFFKPVVRNDISTWAEVPFVLVPEDVIQRTKATLTLLDIPYAEGVEIYV